jgi:hypothetical protein
MVAFILYLTLVNGTSYPLPVILVNTPDQAAQDYLPHGWQMFGGHGAACLEKACGGSRGNNLALCLQIL